MQTHPASRSRIAKSGKQSREDAYCSEDPAPALERRSSRAGSRCRISVLSPPTQGGQVVIGGGSVSRRKHRALYGVNQDTLRIKCPPSRCPRKHPAPKTRHHGSQAADAPRHAHGTTSRHLCSTGDLQPLHTQGADIHTIPCRTYHTAEHKCLSSLHFNPTSLASDSIQFHLSSSLPANVNLAHVPKLRPDRNGPRAERGTLELVLLRGTKLSFDKRGTSTQAHQEEEPRHANRSTAPEAPPMRSEPRASRQHFSNRLDTHARAHRSHDAFD